MSDYDDEVNGACVNPAGQGDGAANMSSYPSNQSNMSSSKDGSENKPPLYHDPSTDNMTLADGSNRNKTPQSGGGNMSSLYDYGDVSTQTQCCGPATGSGQNFYSSLFSGGSSGGNGGNQSISSVSDIPISPNVVLQSSGSETTSMNPPELDVVAVGPNGSQNADSMELPRDTSGRLYWNSSNATHVQINGVQVDSNGSMEIPFEDQCANASKIFEVVAWNGDQANSVVRTVTAKMIFVLDVDHQSSYNFAVYPKIPIKEGNYEYFTITGSIEMELSGKYTFNGNSTLNTTTGWDKNSFAVQLTKKFQERIGLINYVLDLKGKFKTPIDSLGDTPNDSVVWADISGTADGYLVFRIKDWGSDAFSDAMVGVKVTVTLCKVERSIDKEHMEKDDSLQDSWKVTKNSILTTDIAPYGGCQISVNMEDGVFSGTMKLFGKIQITPNGKAIVDAATQEFGPWLGLESIINGVAIVLTSAPVIAAGVVTLIVYGYSDIISTEKMVNLRNAIPRYGKEISRGVKDGLLGTNTYASDITVIDEHSAYLAGVAAGNKKRQELINKKEPFSSRPIEKQNEIIGAVEGQCIYKMHEAVFSGEAQRIKKGSGYDTTKLKDLMSAWNNIIGNCPASKGTEYKTLWEHNRVGTWDMTYFDGSW